MSVHCARRLRKQMTPPEIAVWQHLRDRPNGLRFRRQHPLGRYVFDFYCRAAMLAVEIDGFAHDTGDQPERDLRRDCWAHAQGIETLRIAAADVRANLEGVIAQIVDRCLERTPPPPAAVPLPAQSRGGETM